MAGFAAGPSMTVIRQPRDTRLADAGKSAAAGIELAIQLRKMKPKKKKKQKTPTSLVTTPELGEI